MGSGQSYRGRIAPSPTGYLHLGHASTFWQAFERARERGGTLVFRNEDLDAQRCRPQFVQAMFEDLRWYGIEWQEGPDVGGAHAPYAQSQRREFYLDAWRRLLRGGWIYPCSCSRKDLAQSATAPHDDNDEPVYPGTCRPGSAPEPTSPPPRANGGLAGDSAESGQIWGTRAFASMPASPAGVNWRFRVPHGERIEFEDRRMGRQVFAAGRDFGDFLVWRRDDVPAYQLAVVVDDAAMQITEVVRGADLLRSTVRQILLQRALDLPTLRYFHCALMTDASGVRLAKRHDALSLRSLRQQGYSPEQVRAMACMQLRA